MYPTQLEAEEQLFRSMQNARKTPPVCNCRKQIGSLPCNTGGPTFDRPLDVSTDFKLDKP